MQESREVILRIGVHHHDMMALGIFGREVAPAATSMAPGICISLSLSFTHLPPPQQNQRHHWGRIRTAQAPAIGETFGGIGEEGIGARWSSCGFGVSADPPLHPLHLHLPPSSPFHFARCFRGVCVTCRHRDHRSASHQIVLRKEW